MKKSDASVQLIRQIVSHIWEKIEKKELLPSSSPIDIVIPIISKDLEILPLCLEGIRKNVNQYIKDIYIVSPDDKEIIDFCHKEKLIHVEESTILQLCPKDLSFLIKRADGTIVDRSGWIFQQLVKLSGNVGTCDYYLCIDADHILLRPHIFLTDDDTSVFYMSEECNIAYYKNIHRLMGYNYFSLLSYVDHKMLFSKKELGNLRKMIEKVNNGKDWKSAILDSYDRQETSGFSEFELYGDFIQNKIKKPWRHLKLGYSSLTDYNTLAKCYSDNYHCITFPCQLKNK